MFSDFENHLLAHRNSSKEVLKAERCSRFSLREQKIWRLGSTATTMYSVAEHKFRTHAPTESLRTSYTHFYPACSSSQAWAI